MKKLCSIIIPVYNVEDYLEDCIKSVLVQADENFEIILVDDGSTDNSGLMCDNYAKNNKNIRVIHKKNGGLSSARNTGLDASVGKYILFLDSDDGLMDGTLTQLIKEMEQNNLDVYGFSGRVIYSDREESLYQNIDDKYSEIVNNGLALMSKLVPLSTVPFYFFKRDFLIINKIRFWEGIYYEDMDFTIRVFLNNPKIKLSKKIYYIYNKREGSITANVNLKKINDLSLIIDQFFKDYFVYTNEQRKAIERTIVSYILILEERKSECCLSDKEQADVLIKKFKNKYIGYNIPMKIKLIVKFSYLIYLARNIRRSFKENIKR